MRRTLAVLMILAAGAGLDRAAAAGPAPASAAPPANDPADQLVELFGATCVAFQGDPGQIRQFLTQQGAPAMPAQAQDTFLAGRAGKVFDTSVPGVNLALVTLNDGGCEAVVEHADPDAVTAALIRSSHEGGVELTPLGAQGERLPNGVRHAAYGVTLAGRPMHVLVSTAPAPPQAVLTLVPK